MPEDNNKKFTEFAKKILKKIQPRFSFHYVAYTTLLTFVIFSVVSIVTATTPNPGHPWSELGDGVFAVANTQTANRTYTFPDANATVLTTNSLVTVAQGGTGVGTLTGVVIGNGTGNMTGTVLGANQSIRRNGTNTAYEAYTPAAGMTWPAGGAGIPNYSGSSSWGTSYTTTGSGTVLSLSTTPTFTTSIITPLVLGGSTVTSGLTLQTTSGVGTTGADMHFLVGNNGGTEAMTILNNGNVGIGTNSPSAKLSVAGDVLVTGLLPTGGQNLIRNADLSFGDAFWAAIGTGGTIVSSRVVSSDPTAPVRSKKKVTATISSAGTGDVWATGFNIENLKLNTDYNASCYFKTTDTVQGYYHMERFFSDWTGRSDVNSSTFTYANDGLWHRESFSFNTGSYPNVDFRVRGFTSVGSWDITGCQLTEGKQLNTFLVNPLDAIHEGSGRYLTNSTSYGLISKIISNNYTTTNAYSVYVAAPEGTITNKYALVTEAGAGNVGIGTITPTQKLDVSGSIAIPYTSDSTSGIIYKGTDRFIHNFTLAGTDGKNTFVGINAGNFTMTGSTTFLGSYNTGVGTEALKSNTTGYNNTANGWGALQANTTGFNNTGLGVYALYTNSTGNYNTAIGLSSMKNNQSGTFNAALGQDSLYTNTTGSYNVALGWNSGRFIADGSTANQTSGNSIYLGASTKSQASGDTNEIVIGYDAIGNGSNSATLGNTSITKTILQGNVGIGTTTPGEKLEVNGNVKIGTGAVGTTAKFTVRENSLINTIIGSATDDYGKLDWTANAGGAFIVSATAGKTLSLGANNHTGTTADLFINTSGNVGIGTTSPGSILDVQANVGGNIKVMNFQNNGTSGSTYFAVKNGTYEADLEQNNSSNGSFRFGSTYVDTNLANTYTGTLALGAINLVTGNIIRLSVAGGTGTLAGNVGIGTTSPTSILALGGTAARTIQMERNTTAATAGQGLTLSSGGAIAGTADLNGGDLTLKSGISTGTGSSALHFFTATAGTTGTTDRTPTEKMTILGNGNIGIGTTSPSYKLHISSGDSAVSTRYRLQAGDSWDFISGGTTADAYTSASGFTIRNADTGVNALSISSTGNVGIGTTNPTAGKLQVVGAFTGYGTAPLVVQNTNAYADPYMQYSQVWLSSTGSVLASIRNDGTFSMEGSQGQIRGRSINYSSGPTAIDISTDALTLTSKANNANIVLTPNGTGFTILNGNVGIGTTAPGQTLAVVDSGAGTFGFGTSTGLATSRTLTVGNYVDASSTYNAQAFILNGTAARKTLVVRGAASQSGSLFEWQNSAGTGLGAIDSTGSVGIGTTTPTTKLEVKGDGSGIARLYTSAGAARYYFEESAGNIWGNIPLRLHKDTAGNNYNQILTTASGNIAITASGTATGNVGIGTTTPNQQLEITKNFRLPATTYNGGNPYGIIYKDGNPFIHDFNYGNNGTVTTLGGNLFVGQNAGNFTMGSTATSTSHSSYNTGVGYSSLSANTLGYSNTAFGYYSLFANTTGDNNSAVGYASLSSNTTGYRNIANGTQTLYGNTTGNNNTAIGYGAGRYIANGSTLNTTGDYNMFIGTDTKALADNDQNEIVVGYNAIGNGSNTTTIGTGNVLYVGGASITGKVARFTNSTGYCDIDPTTTSLTCSSDINLKKNVTTLENIEFALRTIPDISNESTLEKLSYLTPVVYNWKTESNTSSKHIGFIAQEMEQIFPDLVATDANTGLKSVSYTNITPYLVSAIQEMNLKVVDLSSLDTSVSTSLGYLMKEFLGSVGNNISDLYALVIHTDRVETKTLCVGSTCVTEEQFLEMVNKLSNSGSGSSNTTTTTTDSTNTETTVTTPEATADTTTSSADGASTSSSVTTSSSDPTLPTSSSSSNDSSVTTTTTSEAGDTSSSTSSDTSSDSSPDNSTPAS